MPSQGKKFDRLILIEKDMEDANSLRKLLPSATVYHTDVNDGGMDFALRDIKQGGSMPVLAFVDPEGLAIHWSTLEKLLGVWSDVIINYQPTSVRRAVGSIQSQPNVEKSLNLYFGGPGWKTCQNDDELFQEYCDRIEHHKEIVIPIKVKGPRGFYYYIIVAVRRTGGDQGWIEAVMRAKAKIEKATSEDMTRFLDIFRGTQRLL